jgi:hypothetical protein
MFHAVDKAFHLLSKCFMNISLIVVPEPSILTSLCVSKLISSLISLRLRTILCLIVCKYRFCCSIIWVISESPSVDSFPNGIKNLLASDPPFLVDKLLHRCANSSRKICSETPGHFAIRRAIPVVLSFAPSDLRMYLILLGNKAYEVSSCALPIMSLRRYFISSLYPKAGWDLQHQPIVMPSSTPS